MAQRVAERHRVKVSVTVDPSLLKAVDTFVHDHPELDRSKVFDTALLLWYSEQQEKAIAAQHTAPPSPEESEERDRWHEIQVAAADRFYHKR